MASIAETREQLRLDQDLAIEIANQSLAAVSTLTTVALLTIGGLTLLLALAAIVGYIGVRRGAEKQAENVANQRVDAYIKSKEFKSSLNQKIEDAIKQRWQSTVVVRELQTPDRAQEEEAPFPFQEEADEQDSS